MMTDDNLIDANENEAGLKIDACLTILFVM